MTSEAQIERYLVQQCKKHGGIAEKFVSPGNAGVPDRICSFDQGRVYFVEVKAPGGRIQPAQDRDHERRRRMGFAVFVLWSKADVDTFIRCVT